VPWCSADWPPWPPKVGDALARATLTIGVDDDSPEVADALLERRPAVGGAGPGRRVLGRRSIRPGRPAARAKAAPARARARSTPRPGAHPFAAGAALGHWWPCRRPPPRAATRSAVPTPKTRVRASTVARHTASGPIAPIAPGHARYSALRYDNWRQTRSIPWRAGRATTTTTCAGIRSTGLTCRATCAGVAKHAEPRTSLPTLERRGSGLPRSQREQVGRTAPIGRACGVCQGVGGRLGEVMRSFGFDDSRAITIGGVVLTTGHLFDVDSEEARQFLAPEASHGSQWAAGGQAFLPAYIAGALYEVITGNCNPLERSANHGAQFGCG